MRILLAWNSRNYPLELAPRDYFAQIVGQPILAAAGFQPAIEWCEGCRIVAKEPPKRRLRARLPAPQLRQNAAMRKSKAAN